MEIPQNKVIAREYVEKNYVHKDKIKELIKYKEELICQLETFLIFREKTEKEKNEIKRLDTEIHELKDLLNEEY